MRPSTVEPKTRDGRGGRGRRRSRSRSTAPLSRTVQYSGRSRSTRRRPDTTTLVHTCRLPQGSGTEHAGARLHARRRFRRDRNTDCERRWPRTCRRSRLQASVNIEVPNNGQSTIQNVSAPGVLKREPDHVERDVDGDARADDRRSPGAGELAGRLLCRCPPSGTPIAGIGDDIHREFQ